MKKTTTILLFSIIILFFITHLSKQEAIYATKIEARLYPQQIGVPNLQTPANYPVAGFGRRIKENVWVPFQFFMPDHTGLKVKEAFLYVKIEALDANGDGIADADFQTDTVEGCGKNGRDDGAGLFWNFPSLYSSGENPLTQKTIKINLIDTNQIYYSKMVEILNNEKILHIVSEDDHSVIDAWLDVVYVPEPAAKVEIKNAIKVPKPKDAFPEIALQPAAGNFPVIPVQQATEITFLIEFDVELKAENNDRGPVNIEVTDFLPPGMTFQRFYAADPPATVTSTANNTIVFSPIKLQLPDDGTFLKLFPVKIIYSAILNAEAEGYQFHQNTASVSVRDIGTGNIILTYPIQGERVTALLPKLHLDKFTSTYEVKAGEEVSFTIVARNEGNIYFQNLNVDGQIPAGVTVDPTSIYPNSGTIVGNTIQWRGFSPLNTGVSEGFGYRVTVNNNTPDGTILNDQGFATALVPDFAGAGIRRLNAVSNQVSVRVSNEPIKASIGVTLVADPTKGVYPMYITYTSDVTNTGEVELRDVSLQLTQGTMPLAGNPVFPLNLGTLQSGEVKPVVYKGQIGANQIGILNDIVVATGIPYKDGVMLTPTPVRATANATVQVLSPAVTQVVPSAESQGSKNLLLKIEGINFSPGAMVSFDPDVGINIIPPEAPGFGFVDFTELNYYVNVSDDAPVGEYEVFVTNPNAYTGKTAEGKGITITGEIKDPEITTISPVGTTRGNQNIELIITGGNFALDATVSFGGSGIIVNNTKVLSSHEIKVFVDISETATTGYLNVIVSNPGGKETIGENMFEVIESLGSVELTWDKPVPGEDLSPPSNLTTNLLDNDALPKKTSKNNIIISGPKQSAPLTFSKMHFNHSILDDSIVVIEEVEPNNNFSEAQTINGNIEIYVDGIADVNDNGSIVINYDTNNDDIEDLYKLTTTEPGLEIYLYGFLSNCDLFIFNSPDSSGLIGWSNFIVLEGEEFYYDLEIPAGTYYIGVSIFDPDPQGPESSSYFMDIFGVFGEEVIDTLTEKKLKSFKIYRSLSESAVRTGISVATVDTNTTLFRDKPLTRQNFYYQVTADYGFGESFPSNESTALLTSVDNDKKEQMLSKYNLQQNYPNPFNPTTTINYTIPEKSNVSIFVYNLLGEKITTLLKKEQVQGRYTVNFDGGNLSSGVYFYTIKAGKYINTKKMILLK